MKKYLMIVVAALVVVMTGAMTYGGAVHAESCQNGANIYGNANPNLLVGGPENNVIEGFAGNDVLRGGGCNDHLYGGAGDDKIDGGPGFDWCYGGPGFDVFVNCEVVVQ